MRYAITVFDTDSLRAQSMCDVIADSFGETDVSLHAAKDGHELRRALQHGYMDLLLVDMRARVDSAGVLDFVREIVSIRSCTTVALSGVCESDLLSISPNEFAALIPASANRNGLRTGLFKAFQQIERLRERPFLVHTRNCDRLIHPSRLSFIESNRRKICLHLDDETIEAYGKISEILQTLPSRFVQCHQSFVVNLGFVEVFDRDGLVLTTGSRIPISQKRRKRTREAFYGYVGRVI